MSEAMVNELLQRNADMRAELRLATRERNCLRDQLKRVEALMRETRHAQLAVRDLWSKVEHQFGQPYLEDFDSEHWDDGGCEG